MLKKLKKLARTIEKNRYFNGWIDYPGVGAIYDKEL